MLKIRLSRKGSRHRPFYRVVVSDGRRRPSSSAIEELGFYDPRQSPSVVSIDVDRFEHWTNQGARPSETVAKLVAKAKRGDLTPPAPTEEAAPAKKATPAKAKAEEAKVDEAKVDEAKAEEAPAQEAAASDEAPAEDAAPAAKADEAAKDA